MHGICETFWSWACNAECGNAECGNVECGNVECGNVECGNVALDIPNFSIQ